MIDDAKVSAVMVDLEKFELRSAVDIWDALPPSLREALCSLPKRKEKICKWRYATKDVENGSFIGTQQEFSAAVPNVIGCSGGSETGQYRDDELSCALQAMNLATVKSEIVHSFLSGGSFNEPVPHNYLEMRYVTTPLGEIVRRYGVAVKTIAAAKEACK